MSHNNWALAALAGLLGVGGTVSGAIVGLPDNAPLGTLHLSPANLGSFAINILPGATLESNAPALAAFNRAANQWASKISDPITVTINADLGSFGASIIASTSPTMLQASFDTIRDAMVTDAAGDPSRSIVASLPTQARFSATLKPGNALTGNLVATKANLKALSFTGLDAMMGESDGTIAFNQSYAFDYNNSNGVTTGTVDFETAAAHEIGHILGFDSAVDESDKGFTSISPTTLDLFRFGRTSNTPSSPSDFTSFPRNLTPGADTVTDDLTNQYRMSTGYFLGDGRQASHWKDDSLTGTYIGIMDPTLATGVIETVGTADLRAMNLIGYEVSVPEPTSIGLMALGGMLLLKRTRRIVCVG